jgi:hypothetical protein
MDSGNSGSLQSSSGADDEFDSRCGAGEDDSSPLSALLRQPPSSASVLPMTGFSGSFYGIQDLAALPTSHWSSTTPLPAAASVSPPLPSGQADAPAAAPPVPAPSRGSRKRTRASRRAPTTVLTTDTSNFRAMVQEFTGIPSPPFAASARPRFDHHLLFPSRPTAALSPYLLRTFAPQRHLQPQQAAPCPQPFVAAAPPANTASTAGPTTSKAVGQRLSYHQLASAAPSLGMPDHSGSGGNCLSFQSSTARAQLLDGNNASRYPIFDAAAAAQRHGVTNSRHRDHGGDDLSGLVGAGSVSSAGGCKTYARPASASRAGAPLPADRNAQSTTPAVRAQGVEPSWICTSE